MSEPYCQDCRYWEPLDPETIDGECHRHAPRMAGTIAPHGDAIHQDPKRAIWPTVLISDWCGEFHPTPEPTDERI